MNKINKIKGTLDIYNKKYIIINNIFKIIKKILKLNGYIPIITPSIENINILKFKNIKNKIIYYLNNKNFLIYDLTISLIRFLKNNYNNLIFPFKRYQIQKVWRGEKPQKNRFREFYQLDIDIVTFKKDKNQYLELELINICNNIFKKLNIKVIFFINNIKLLFFICKFLKIKKNKSKTFIKIIDKNINYKKIIKLLINNKILNNKNKKKFIKLIKINLLKNNFIKIKILKKIFYKKKKIIKKLININYLLKIINKLKLNYLNIKFNFLLSRGLNYYNDIIFEIFKKKSKISLLGGGRYDNYLILNNKKTYYLGMSFGIYRIYNIYKKIYFKEEKNKKILFINLNLNYIFIYKIINKLKFYNIILEIYPYYTKISKQILYAKKKKINFLIFYGKNEIKNKYIKLKNLKKKKEFIFYKIKKLINYIKKNYK
ncbi:MAG: ATP phosphoribosyltransferase regulatory subunit [Candidatus Shikimatogenerans sp. JK-2022]|nr:ATP phosphoribosyltransferase regulatory subunit [Candidatus Shikimatogenerans bostrichidophilus]